MRARTALLALYLALFPGSSVADELQRALAAAFVKEAVDRCGYETSSAGSQLLKGTVNTKPAADTQKRFVENLWQRTWACDPGFIGRSCMASRLSLCERAFLEYGPGGAVLPDLLKPIIHK